TDDLFKPRPLPTEPFADSMGVNTGTPEKIVIEFDASVAAFIREREWHRSQVMTALEGGTLRVTLNVCNDRALVAWVLGFGPEARVVSPPALARQIFEAADLTRQRYRPATFFDSAGMRALKAG
ncbi:MAG TPA: WYL domain-containing protein, partial [Gemmatimonadaceae bacterium]|nr:WYL domain-containing protein [Gemmatimonadaceae bacterium]